MGIMGKKTEAIIVMRSTKIMCFAYRGGPFACLCRLYEPLSGHGYGVHGTTRWRSIFKSYDYRLLFKSCSCQLLLVQAT